MKLTPFAFCLALLNSPLVAADSLIVGIDDQSFLPHYTMRNDQLNGFAARVFQLFGKTSGHQFTFKAVAKRHLLKKMRAGEIDLRYPDNPNWQPSLKNAAKPPLYYSDDIVQYNEGSLVIRENASMRVEQVKTIGIVRGREPVSYLALLNSGKLRAKENSDLDSLIKSALLGRIDVAYYNIEVAQYRLNAMGISNDLLVNEALPRESGYYKLSTLHHKNVIDEFNRFLKQHQADLDELKSKYHLH